MTDTIRRPDHAIDPLFHERWSPRAFDGSTIDEETLASLFEAARWAPSAYNVQPWRFLHARRDTPDWDVFLRGLIAFNRGWAKDASVLVYILSDTVMGAGGDKPPTPSHSHSFDAGAAWAQLALQAHRMGLATHGMTGLEFDTAREVLAVPERFRIEATIAIGRRGDPAILPEGLRARETPSDRRPIGAFSAAGAFPADWR